MDNFLCKPCEMDKDSQQKTQMSIFVDENGKGISFYIFAYNSQPNVQINYATGDSRIADGILEQGYIPCGNCHP